ncbi:MAG: TraB/GumN family protein [Acidobacteriota bacterium]
MNEVPLASAPDAPVELPSSVRRIEFDGREVFLVGTAHVSRESVADVRNTIEAVRPETVCVELDEGRYQNLTDQGRWKRTNISEVIRKGKAMLLLSSLIMTAFQRRIGKKLGVMPGAELLEGIKAAEDVGARMVLADRDIQTTLKRTWGNFGFIDRVKVAGQLIGSLFVTDEVDEQMIEELKSQEKLGDVLEMLAQEFPAMKGPLIDERDVYLAQKIREAPGRRLVAVVGAGHVPGITTSLGEDHDLVPLESIPRPSLVGRIVKWAIPGLILALFVYAFLTGGAQRSIDSIYIWFLVNGILSALGAAVALGHPLTILSAFFAAPLTSLNPMIAAGWVSGLVQAIVKKPTVQDLEDLPEAINSVRGFWANPVSRILLVVVFSNLGSMLGTFLAGSWIAARLFG